MSASLNEWLQSSALGSGNAYYVDELYERFLADPASVPLAWRDYFQGLGGRGSDRAHGPVREALAERARRPRLGSAVQPADLLADPSAKQGAVSRMIQVYANRGHLVANIDPLGLMDRPMPRVLELGYFGLGEEDLDTEFLTGSDTEAVPTRMKLREMIRQLKHVYCGTIGAEFAHVSASEERLWLQRTFQEDRLRHRFSPDERRNILWQLTAAEGLERYLHTKYVGQKRFSLEGGDSLIPMLDTMIQHCGLSKIKEMVIGMAHRGRLNVLVNVLGKESAKIFAGFEGKGIDESSSGDVKYHLGFSSDLQVKDGSVHVALAFNPSHLEIVAPVV